MADRSINELVAASAISASDLFVLEQNATAKKLTGQVLINFLTAAADGHGGISVIAKTGTAGLVDTYTITYADTSISTFTITNGAKGDTGQAYYVWIRYSAVQPTQDNDVSTTPDDWMGIYTGTSATAPTAYAAYTWYEIKGAKGNTGAAAAISNQTVTYQASVSGTTAPTGTWQSDIPAVTQGNYLWTRVVLTFNDGTSITSYSVGRMGVDGQGSPSSTTPNAAGTATVGVETAYARGDHVHPKELTDGAVTEAKIAAGAVTADKLSENARPVAYNLLDNSDFTNPVNQRWAVSGSFAAGEYFLDRWVMADGAGNVTYTEDGITLSADAVSGFIQMVPEDKLRGGKTYTFAVQLANGNKKVVSGTYTKSTAWAWVATLEDNECKLRIGKSAQNLLYVYMFATGNPTVSWAALYDGEYTAETLPKYMPKGYVAELAECQRCFYRLHTQNSSSYGILAFGFVSSASQARFVVALPTAMRINPTVTSSGGLRYAFGDIRSVVTSLATQSWNGSSIVLIANTDSANLTSVGAAVAFGHNDDANAYVDFSADL